MRRAVGSSSTKQEWLQDSIHGRQKGSEIDDCLLHQEEIYGMNLLHYCGEREMKNEIYDKDSMSDVRLEVRK